MADTSPGSSDLLCDSLTLLDILKSFNNPINEEQAWAVCYQCARYFLHEQNRLKYRELYTHGNRALRVKKDGDIVVDVGDKGTDIRCSPAKKRNSITGKDIKVVTESDKEEVKKAIQALGLVIYQALDYGLDHSEERHLGLDLEALIEYMTNPDDIDDESQNIDDEGIEKDSEEDGQLHDRCTFQDIFMFCERHLSNDQDAYVHYKAVCRALCTESSELVTFLDKISNNQERLKTKAEDDDLAALDDLQRADWARLWVQCMQQLRRGVRLKKVEHASITPSEFELTPFEMILDDIRTRRYTLNKVMVNGDLPPKVKSDAHAVILDFIRSRPPLHSVKKRVLKSPPKQELGPFEKLLHEIKQGYKLRPIRDGKLVVETSRTKLNNDDIYENPLPARKIIKPDYANLLDSFDDDDTDDSVSQCSRRSSVASPSPDRETPAWRRSIMRDVSSLQDRQATLQRRHTIMVCESPDKVSPESPIQNQTIFENDETFVEPASDKRSSSGHETGVKLKRSVLVSRSHACNSEVRKRLSLKLHGSPDVPVQVKSHVNACSLHTSKTSPSESTVHNSSDNVRRKSLGRRILVSKSSQPVPIPRSLSAELPPKQLPKPVPRSDSSSEIRPRPRPVQRSSSTSVLLSSNVSSKVSEVRPVPKPRERSRSPSQRQSSDGVTNESRPVPRPRERSRSPSPNRTLTEQTPSSRPRPRPRERSRSPSPDRPRTSERKMKPIPAPRTILSPVEGSVSDTVSNSASLSETVRTRVRQKPVRRANSHQVTRHSTDLSHLGAMHDRRNDLTHESKSSVLKSVTDNSEEVTVDDERTNERLLPSATNDMSPTLSELNVQDLLLVSRSVTTLQEEAVSATNRVINPDPSQDSCSDSKWQHPIECLSLNLEEVSHIRMVLTKAELESIINNTDLYTLISKGKLCFTCKTVKFSMFGQWGTRCKICKRNVCNTCLRKMNIPMDHFQNIPVHTLSPIPLNQETLDILKVYESTGSVPHSPNMQRKQQQRLENKSPKRQLQRSHTISSGTQPPMLPNKNVLKGPQMSICCDCKGMIMEIIRTSRSSIALINQRQTQPPPRTRRSESSEDTSLKRHSSFSANVRQFFTSS